MNLIANTITNAFRNRNENTYAICGLGNPGKEYENTRHNIGYRVVDDIARGFGVEIRKSKFNANFVEIKHSGKRILLIKPLTYMNNSGDCLRKVAGFYKLELKRLIVIYDDIDLPVGVLRIRQFGGPGTHNGMKSITDALGSDQFPRIRIGIGSPPKFFDLKKYVLSSFSDEDRAVVENNVTNAAKAALDIIESGIDISMNRYNTAKN